MYVHQTTDLEIKYLSPLALVYITEVVFCMTLSFWWDEQTIFGTCCIHNHSKTSLVINSCSWFLLEQLDDYNNLRCCSDIFTVTECIVTAFRFNNFVSKECLCNNYVSPRQGRETYCFSPCVCLSVCPSQIVSAL